MATSGTTDFNPSIANLTLYAFGLCGIRRTELTQQHMEDARLASGLMLTDWDNETPNLWKVDLVTQALTQGVASYNVDADTVTILDTYIRQNDGASNQYDRIIWPISRTEYASQPNKLQQGTVTTFWYDRLISPTITLWQVPDNSTDELVYYRVTRLDDANQANGETVDLPSRWLNAFAYGLGARLADMYAPDRADRLLARATLALTTAKEQDTETNDTLYFGPSIAPYYTR